ncbi:MAG TPA: OmpA family protein [Ohtaekwangia sp.]|nr:OmpA family protein [Ohtaekwangia sp.]
MKTIKLFALVGIFLPLMFSQPTKVLSHGQGPFEEYPNYVVIGAFSIHKNAIRFTSHAHRDLNLNARFELNPNRNLYYVYVLSTTDRAKAIHVALKLRAESELTDTWVYSGFLGPPPHNGRAMSPGVDINPATEQHMDRIPNEIQDNAPAISESDGSRDTAASPAVEQTADIAEPLDDEIEGKKFYFKLYRAMDNTPVEGDVDAIDTERSKKIATYKGNAPVKVPTPPGKVTNLSLLCEVFGYRKVQREVDYNNPQGEGIETDEDGRTVIPFELVRLQKGDIAVMYNVYFFKDAAIMRPESRYEVNSLLEMLNENKAYRIKIHGHTNGGAAGKIVSKNPEGDNFFALTDTRDGYGSAKKLSQERAEIIRDFLASNGVDASRMQIKAWGGKRPIHDKHHTRAQENVRVEIEILEDK